MRYALLTALSALLLCGGAGCSPQSTPGGPLLGQGRVFYEGKPLNAVSVSLAPPGGATILAAGLTKPDGTFELRSPEGQSKALPDGEYTILLEATGGEGWEFPASYRDVLQSPIKANFRAGGVLKIDAPAGSVLPAGLR